MNSYAALPSATPLPIKIGLGRRLCVPSFQMVCPVRGIYSFDPYLAKNRNYTLIKKLNEYHVYFANM